MRMIDLIIKKRQGNDLSRDEIHFIISEYVQHNIPDYQISALLMAIFFNGLNDRELFYLTDEMIHSGEQLDFSMIKGIKADKHSTGGVGDKVSLILAPLAAACGLIVPMMSGRGLGHTGGTLDKLESIPGFNVYLKKEEINQILNQCGYVMMGQTENIVPADKKLYALRDVTGTVESIPLIASSIMSKKIAEGTDVLVMDIKCGKGAFMSDLQSARKLGEKILSIGRSADKKVSILITNMDQPLGLAIGNYLEILESIACLKGNGPNDLDLVTRKLTARMLLLGQKAATLEDAYQQIEEAIASGRAYQYFLKNVELQGGDLSYIENDRFSSKFSRQILAPRAGYIEDLDAHGLGIASMIVGAGRQKKEDNIDYHCGILLNKKVGDQIKKNELIATIYANKNESLEQSQEMCRQAIQISAQPVTVPPILLDEIGS